MPKPPTAVIVGLGYGLAHLHGLRAAGCEVVAVCQRNQEAARALAARHGVPEACADWEDMIARLRPDIVAIATPPATHLPILRAAMSAGAHVLCEKPLALDRAEALAMIDISKRSGRAAITGFNWRFPPAMRRFKEMVESGFLGRVFHVNARWFNAGWASESAAATWRMDRAQAGHGAMGDQGVHLIDMVRWLFGRDSGEFSRVCAQSGIAYASRPANAEDHCSVIAELASGAQVALTVSRAAHGLNEHSLEAYGSNGALSLRVQRSGADWHVGELHAAAPGELYARVPVERGEPIAPDTERHEIIGRSTVAPMLAGMLRAIERGEPPSPSLEDGMRAQAVLDAVLESVQSRGWVQCGPAN
ncbi:MAG: Gfo/Idh/MocA family protein [Burkholderiales bacterium]